MTDVARTDDELRAMLTLAGDQREVNAHLVELALAVQAQHEAAEDALELAAAREAELRAHAEFRELFIGILGHDLRNPLSSIMLATDALTEDERLDDPAQANVARIRRSAARMTRMIEQLLDLTRARLGGGVPIAPAPANLGVIARHVVDEFAGRVVQLECRGELDGIWDADRLAEVVSNLTGNAIDHATPGTIVRVEAYRDGETAVIAIHNQGSPVPAERLARLFQPFRSGPPETRARAGHLGLGLYIAHQIVLSHGGTITATSSGVTTFLVRLPCVPVPAHDLA